MAIGHLSTTSLRIIAAGFWICAAAPAFAQDGNAEIGQQVFKKCGACHSVGEGAKNKVGPVLTGVIGRTAGTYEGFKYGEHIKAAGEAGLVWSPDLLFDYLADPRAFLREYLSDPKAKSKMPFKLGDEAERRDVIAYLATFSSDTDEDTASNADSDSLARVEFDAASAAGKVCVVNGSGQELLFVAEARNGPRKVETLAHGGSLCAESDDDGGVVRVFENADALEGCSRLAGVGEPQNLIRYVAFDNCTWG